MNEKNVRNNRGKEKHELYEEGGFLWVKVIYKEVAIEKYYKY